MNKKNKLFRTDDDGSHENGDRMFEECNGFDITQDSPQIVDGEDNSL